MLRWISERIAVMSAVVSVGALFAQIYNSDFLAPRETAISASVDLSITNFHGAIADLRNAYYALTRMHDDEYAQVMEAYRQNTVPDLQQQLLDKAAAFIYYLDYVAKLINEGKIKMDYMAPIILCTVWNGSDLASDKRRVDLLPKSGQLKSIVEFRKNHPEVRSCSVASSN